VHEGAVVTASYAKLSMHAAVPDNEIMNAHFVMQTAAHNRSYQASCNMCRQHLLENSIEQKS